jgi:hypothetical protein
MPELPDLWQKCERCSVERLQKTRYLMIVSYGVNPGPSAYIAEALQWKGDGKPIYGTISADKAGRIIRIE